MSEKAVEPGLSIEQAQTSCAEESGCKRKRDVDDVGGTSNRKSGDEPEHEDWLDKYTSGDHMCWIKKSRCYRVQQIQKIRAKRNASELLCCMNANIKNLTSDDIACYYKWWLTIATQYSHISLVYLILANRESSPYNSDEYVRTGALLYEDVCHFGRPFLIAIESGNKSLVTAFLLAGTSVADPYVKVQNAYQQMLCDGNRVHDITQWKPRHEDLSGIEYAFIVNQPEILKLLVGHFDRQHPPRDVTDFNDTYNNELTPVEQCITRPLHIIMKLAAQFCGPHFTELPALVQQIIDDGTDADCLDSYGDTPLQVLLHRIRIIAPLDEVGAAYRSTLIDITKILLKTDTKRNTAGHNPLINFEHLMFPYGYFEGLDMNALRDHFNFVSDLGRLLLLHGADLTQFRFYERIPDAARMMLKMYRSAMWRRVCQISLMDEIMDSLSNLFQSALIAGAKNRQTKDTWDEFVDSECWCMMHIAEHSSQPDRSEKLIYAILNTFSASNLEKLRDESQSLLGLDEWPKLQRRAKHTIEYVNIVMSVVCAPRRPSLQDLSRQAIIKAMSVRALLPYESIDLGLPPMLKAFVLL